jgi:hypothetical protein
MKFKKGSKEAKEYMASIRGMKKSAPKKKAAKKAAPKKAAKKAAPKKKAVKKAAPKKAAITKQYGTSNRNRDLQRVAKLPGRRKSEGGSIYNERRKNRSDAPGSLLGIGSVSLNQIGAELYEMEAKINMLKFRKKEARTMTEKKELQTRINELNTQFKALRSYLNSRAKFK